MAASASAMYDMWVAHYPDVNATVGQDVVVRLMLLGADSPSQPVTFYMYSTAEQCGYGGECSHQLNGSVILDGRIGSFHDGLEMVKNVLKEEDVAVSAWDPGTYRIYWGLNLTQPVNVTLINSSNDAYDVLTMNLSESFLLTVTGNHSDINDSIGVNESDYGVVKQRYGWNDTATVAQRMAAWWAAHSAQTQQSVKMNASNVSIVNSNLTNVRVVPKNEPMPSVVQLASVTINNSPPQGPNHNSAPQFANNSVPVRAVANSPPLFDRMQHDLQMVMIAQIMLFISGSVLLIIEWKRGGRP